MHLIVDSGSSKTLWCLVEGQNLIQEIITQGLNPYISSAEQIEATIKDQVIPRLINAPNQIYFYGAGCSTDANKKIIASALLNINSKASIEVEHDLLAVARALCLNKPGIAVILGTGSNSCLYDGETILKNTPSLGYVLGDEGSGSYIGKQFLSDLWYDLLPANIKEQFLIDYPQDLGYYLHNIYKEPNANAFLASFCKWISAFKNENYINQLLKNSFSKFIEKQILPYGVDISKTINCIGSIAFYFQNEWKEVILQYGYEIGKIEQTPISGLIQYHSLWKE